jgi:hypothetical protein
MVRTDMSTCAYCNTPNSLGANTCPACGAPLEIHKPTPHPKADSKSSMNVPASNYPEIDISKVGEKIDEAYFTVLNIYTVAWRTLAEAIAIAVGAFIIGAAGGVARAGFLGILGGIALGIAVGLTQKNFYITLISAPVGAMIGLGVGAIFWVAGISKIFPLIVTLLSIVGAIMGGKQRPVLNRKNWWERLRPFFGALGGLAFGLLGMLLGWGILSTIKLFQ